MALLLGAANSQAQDNQGWSGIAVGASLDLFNGEIPEHLSHALKLETSPVIKLKESPAIYALPGLHYSTLGTAGIQLGVYSHWLTIQKVKLYAGGGVSPINFTTEGPLAKTAGTSASIDIGVTFKQGLTWACAVRQEFYSASTPELPDKLTTIKLGVIF